MKKITLQKTHALLENLAEYVKTEVATKKEVDEKIGKNDAKIDKLADYVMTEVATKMELAEKIRNNDSKIDKLAEYVMTEVPKKAEIDQLTDYVMTEVAKKSEVDEIKTDVKELKQKMDIIITGQDKQAKQLEDLKTEQITTNATLLRHEKRITLLEQK